jgi:hypothetical protein
MTLSSEPVHTANNGRLRFNWEWMIRCVNDRKAGLVIVSRDSDYGVTVDGKSYINDELRREFSERVSQTRTLLLFSRLTDALKSFAIPVSKKEEQVEKDLLPPSQTNIEVIGSVFSQPGSSLFIPVSSGSFQPVTVYGTSQSLFNLPGAVSLPGTISLFETSSVKQPTGDVHKTSPKVKSDNDTKG